MIPVLLTLNVGSSSLKFSLFSITAQRTLQCIITGKVAGLDSTPIFNIKDHVGKSLFNQQFENDSAFQHDAQSAALTLLMNWIQQQSTYQVIAVGHRVVHGGALYIKPTLITDNIVQQLKQFIPLAPLHQPYCLAAMQKLIKDYPNILQVACFDTAFHATQSALAQQYALPDHIADIPLKRYGFHGLSYEYIASVLPQYIGEQATGKIIVAHLGHGASMCAMLNQKSIATTMGVTALDGLPMGTRCGNIDPGIILYLLAQQKMSAQQITELLYLQSGMLGVSGISSDMQILLNDQSPKASKAVNLFVYRICRELGSLVSALHGLDAIIFTAGIGEHAAFIREQVCLQSQWLGIMLDQTANRRHEQKISTAASKVSVWVIPTDEESIIAQHTFQFVA